MRIMSIAAVFAVVLAFGLASVSPAEAGWRRDRTPDGWGRTRTVTHHVYYPRYRHVYRVHPHTDPYAYYYEPRGYYTKSSSRYWRPARKVRKPRSRNVYGHKYRYKPAWGYKWAKRRHRYHRRHRH